MQYRYPSERFRRVHMAADRAKPLRATVGRKGRFPIVDWVRAVARSIQNRVERHG